MKSLLQFLRQLQFWLCSGQMHYIHGADTLPPPLSAPEERAMLEALANGNTDAREQLIVHNLLNVLPVFRHGCRDVCQKAAHTQGTEREVLGGHQGILVKEGQLGAAESNIHNGRPFLYDLIKFTGLGSNGLIADKTLL